ncbi:virion core protein (lumpy skin disease virus) [Flavobacterium rivuli WB 3.3-2 = DSM 21788]|uniref:Virion core protein (Lumpy skin disease virus) n=1 Tax=Flavobacterium rivuli WB 3.3-2 = DSM 21788 TaxID=1121895 RepID=A0A0A2LY05_9FLAO|nr:SPFH domain-containing protein [Flavobacterium rivuli]KGO85257.1 virion core protein (lumpy skin disease virus) [Flavobacterium rivuli WB 3.3-2 = DSM 21788]
MSLLNIFKNNDGGFMDVIRCEEQEYLVHKWTPGGALANSTTRENAIRYGSRLRVMPGEAAIFLYPQQDGTMMDVIEGPVDQTIKTANFPVLSNIVGAFYGGESPFMAEVYFLNLGQNIQIKLGIPYFDVFDNRFPDLGVPCAVRGSITFNVVDYTNFIKLYRLLNFELDELKEKIKDFYTRKIKAIVLNIPADTGLPVMQLERKLDDINEYVTGKLKPELETDFGINLKRLDINTIELDKTSSAYMQLKGATTDQQSRFINAKTDIEVTNLGEMARIQRKDMEMGVEGKNFAVHQMDLQADILKTAARHLGDMSNVNLGNGSGFSPVGIMTGMAVGGAMGTQMGGMMGNLTNTPPPPPQGVQWHIAINGQQSGPYTLAQLKEYALQGQFTREHYVWKTGMAAWEPADITAGLSDIFGNVPPPPPAAPASKSKINLEK